MDYNVVSVERWIANEESANEAACNAAAEKAGYTPQEADMCDDGCLNCDECPWGGK